MPHPETKTSVHTIRAMRKMVKNHEQFDPNTAMSNLSHLEANEIISNDQYFGSVLIQLEEKDHFVAK